MRTPTHCPSRTGAAPTGDDAEIRSALDDCTPGKWTTCLGADLYVAVSDGTEEGSRSDVLATIAVEHATSPRQTADAWLMSRGKAHAAEVLRLREECARLRAIVAGRTVPPTDAEIDAHEAAGGSWVVTPDGWAPHYVAYGRTLRRFAEQAREPCMPAVTWRTLDATGRPCAWPVVDGGESREGEGR